MKIPYVQFTFLVLISCSLVSCNSPKTSPNLDKRNQERIAKLSDKIVHSINHFDFSVINNSWNNEAFKNRLSGIGRVQKSVFEHLFESKLKFHIKAGNLSLIHDINDYNGQASFLSLNHFEEHSELILLVTFPMNYDFIKYRIELIKGKPAIVDFYNFKDNLWYSESIINSLQWNSEYDAYSKERHDANAAVGLYKQAVTREEKEAALRALNNIPKTDVLGNELSIMKLTLAMDLGDTIYMGALASEYEHNQSLYMQYLYYWLTDTTRLGEVYQSIEKEIGESVSLDTLWNGDRVWN